MARIRTIKPEFWTDPTIIECSLNTRLLFIGMWNFADDSGNIEAHPIKIKALIFPVDKIKIEPLLEELCNKKLIIKYSANGKNFFHIRSFAKHQKINRPSSPTCPEYSDSMNTHGEVNDNSLTEIVNSKGKEIVKEIVKDIPFVEIISDFNTVFNTNYKTEPVATDIKKLIKARWVDKCTLDDFKTVHRKIYKKWSTDPEMQQYMRPHTLYTGKFQSYLNLPIFIEVKPKPIEKEQPPSDAERISPDQVKELIKGIGKQM